MIAAVDNVNTGILKQYDDTVYNNKDKAATVMKHYEYIEKKIVILICAALAKGLY